jgi:uncharacterized membrane protein YvbJ
MRIKYCKSCGHKNQFIGLEPKFCGGCGKDMQSESKSQLVKSKNIKKQRLDGDETDSEFVPNITSLQFSVSPFEKKTFKMEELFDLDENGGSKET